MTDDFNACVKTQLATYLPGALRDVLKRHEEVIRHDMTVKTEDKAKDKTINQTATMKATIEQQKAARAVIVHIEQMIKLARLVIDDESINEAPLSSKDELNEMIDEAQARVTENRSEEQKAPDGK